MSRDNGRTGPVADDYTIRGRDDEMIYLRGRLLGFASSHREVHDHAVTYDAEGRPLSFAAPRERCSACRWFEVRLFDVEHELSAGGEPVDRRARYLILTSGMSVVPGEVEMRRASWTDSGYEVVELLTQRRGERPFLPAPSARVLAQASAWNDDIRDAYVDRAVI